MAFSDYLPSSSLFLLKNCLQSERGRATRLFSSKEKRGGGGGGGDQPGSGSAIAGGPGLGSSTFGVGHAAAAERGAISTSGAMCASNRTSDLHRLVNQSSQGIGAISDSLSVSILSNPEMNPSVALPANWEALRDLNCIQNAVEMTCPIIWQFAGNSNADSYSAFRV